MIFSIVFLESDSGQRSLMTDNEISSSIPDLDMRIFLLKESSTFHRNLAV